MSLDAESRAPGARRGASFERRACSVVVRWQQACERLELALAELAALRGRVAADDPAWIAAQLRVAQARRRRHEAAEQFESLDADFDADA